MKRALLLVLLPVLTGCSRLPIFSAPPVETPAINVAEAGRSVVIVAGSAPSCDKQLLGSGFVYAKERVMTAAHNLAGAEKATVKVGDNTLPAEVVVYDPLSDVAVLYVKGLDLPPLALDSAHGDLLLVIGYPKGKLGDVRSQYARVAAVENAKSPDIYRKTTVTREVFTLTDVDISPGQSGGPLISADGRVAGMLFATATQQERTAYGLTSGVIAAAARQGTTATEVVSTQTCE